MSYNYNKNRSHYYNRFRDDEDNEDKNYGRSNKSNTWTVVSNRKYRERFDRNDRFDRNKRIGRFDKHNRKDSNSEFIIKNTCDNKDDFLDSEFKELSSGDSKELLSVDSKELPSIDQDIKSDIDCNSDYDGETLRYKNENYKKILCKNIHSIGRCVYTNKCLYAHSLDEQNVESIRSIAYDMIKKDIDLSNIDLSKNKNLYTNLLILSKLCQQCEDGTCTGGYNCKHGACDKIYVICQIDLNKGTCEGGCGKLHLTKKGLVPYGVNIVKNLKAKVVIPKATIINDDFFKKLNDNISKTNLQNNIDDPRKFTISKYSSDCSNDIDNIKPVKPIKNEVLHGLNENNLQESRESIENNSQDTISDSYSSDNDVEDENTWANIVKNDKSHNSNDDKSYKSQKNHDNIDDIASDDSTDSIKSNDSDDDLLRKLPDITTEVFDITFNRDKKLTKSIFKIDMMCV